MYIDFESPNEVDLNLRKFENIDQLKETDAPSTNLPSLTLKELNSIYDELQNYKNVNASSFFDNYDLLKQKMDTNHLVFDYNTQCGLHHPYQKVITINKDLSLDKSINYFRYGIKHSVCKVCAKGIYTRFLHLKSIFMKEVKSIK